jgi:L-fuconate dehydratase
MKVGANQKDDLRRGGIIRSIIDDPAHLPEGHVARDPESLVGKNAGPTGCVFMIDANQVIITRFLPLINSQRFLWQVWDVPQAIEYVKGLESLKPW